MKGEKSRRSELNRRPTDYESVALPLSYAGRGLRLYGGGLSPSIRGLLAALLGLANARDCGTAPARLVAFLKTQISRESPAYRQLERLEGETPAEALAGAAPQSLEAMASAVLAELGG